MPQWAVVLLALVVGGALASFPLLLSMWLHTREIEARSEMWRIPPGQAGRPRTNREPGE